MPNRASLNTLILVSMLSSAIAVQALAQSTDIAELPHPIAAGQRISASGLNENFRFLLNRIDFLAAESEQMRVQLDRTTQELKASMRENERLDEQIAETLLEARNDQLPTGSVVAFDRSESKGSCPEGWSFFEAAGGRVIVGAGPHGNEASFGEFSSFADGGQLRQPTFGDIGFRELGGAAKDLPIIPLYFCRKQ